MNPEARPFFMPVGRNQGQRYCIFHPASGGRTRAAVLYLHPFAEEMNKARRMAAIQARALAEAGCAVLQIDLLGCGDSSGDFGDASWEQWVQDGVLGCEWLCEQVNDAPLWLWGLRTGCLLTTEVAARLTDRHFHFLFWAPVAEGRQQLQQFLRLKSASDMLAGKEGAGTKALRQQLAAGKTVEVAGYSLAPVLANGLDEACLNPPTILASGIPSRLEWVELSSRDDAGLSPVGTRWIEAWAKAGHLANPQVVQGPAFWQTSEIEDAPNLVSATVEALLGVSLARA